MSDYDFIFFLLGLFILIGIGKLPTDLFYGIISGLLGSGFTLAGKLTSQNK